MTFGMKDLTSSSFGYVMAFLLPGLLSLYALGYWSSSIRSLLEPVLKADATIGPSAIVLLAALGIGLVVSAIRWKLFEELLYRRRRLTPDVFDGLDPDKLAFVKTFAEEHYRYHQFYGGCFVGMALLFSGWLSATWPRWNLRTLWAALLFLGLEGLLERGAFDSFRKYTERTKAIAVGRQRSRGER